MSRSRILAGGLATLTMMLVTDAQVWAQAQPPADSVPASGSDGNFDLDSLVEDEGAGPSSLNVPLTVSGFADFSFYLPLYKPDSVWAGAGLPAQPGFYVGNLNLYFSRNISERCRALAEVRFLYEPHGASDAGGQRIDTTVADHAAVDRPIQWGAIRIERVHVDCDLTSWLTLRMGQWFTPYGIWNIDHGSPTIIAIRRPYVVGDELLPEQQTGLQLFATRARGDFRLGYYLTLSNGRGQIGSYEDLDSNKAIGGRLELGYSRLGELALGGSYYRGRYTATKPARLDTATGKGIIEITSQFDEQSFGLDLSWDWRGLAFRSEYLHNERRYTAAGRPATGALLTPDAFRRGGYALLGYRTHWLGIMPYFMTQSYRLLESPTAIVDKVTALHGGLNVLLSPAMVLKVEFIHADFPPSPIPGLEYIRLMEAQISWAF
jgi:hypothetical protein